jgi:hypothetical protein
MLSINSLGVGGTGSVGDELSPHPNITATPSPQASRSHPAGVPRCRALRPV